MKPPLISLLFSAFLFIILGCASPATELPTAQEKGVASETPPKREWALTGEYFEGCPCGVPCPCIFYFESDVEQCTVISNYYVQKGRHEGTDLAGRNIVFVAFPTSRQMYKDRIDGAVYLDESTPESDRKALEHLALKVLDGSWYGTIFAVKYVKIDRTFSGNERSIVIPGIMELKVRALEGRDGKVQRIEHNKMIGTIMIAPSVINKYKDHGRSWDIKERSGFIAPFRVDPRLPRKFSIGEEP